MADADNEFELQKALDAHIANHPARDMLRELFPSPRKLIRKLAQPADAYLDFPMVVPPPLAYAATPTPAAQPVADAPASASAPARSRSKKFDDLRSIRDGLNMSQEKFAEACKVSLSTIQRGEKGLPLDQETIRQIKCRSAALRKKQKPKK